MADYREAFVGVDVAKARNAIAIAEAGREGEVRFFGEVDASEASMRRVVARLAGKCDHLHFCYEDGVVEAVDVAADAADRFGAVMEDGAPNEFGLYRLEERLDQPPYRPAPARTGAGWRDGRQPLLTDRHAPRRAAVGTFGYAAACG